VEFLIGGLREIKLVDFIFFPESRGKKLPKSKFSELLGLSLILYLILKFAMKGKKLWKKLSHYYSLFLILREHLSNF
jgi:hypothetical protein